MTGSERSWVTRTTVVLKIRWNGILRSIVLDTDWRICAFDLLVFTRMYMSCPGKFCGPKLQTATRIFMMLSRNRASNCLRQFSKMFSDYAGPLYSVPKSLTDTWPVHKMFECVNRSDIKMYGSSWRCPFIDWGTTGRVRANLSLHNLLHYEIFLSTIRNRATFNSRGPIPLRSGRSVPSGVMNTHIFLSR